MRLLDKAQNQVGDEKDKLRILSKSKLWLQRNLTVLNPSQNSGEAFSLADQNKSVLLLQATKSEAIYRLGGVSDSLIQEHKRILDQRQKLQAKLSESRSVKEKKIISKHLN